MVPGRRGLACLIAAVLISAGVNGVPTRAQTPTDDPGFEFQWGLIQIGAQDAWEIGTGRGATVAVLDSGVDFNHEDLKGQVAAGGRDFTNDDDVAQDDNGQGTHVAGIIAASTNNKVGVAGVAHHAKVLPIKVHDDEGEGFESHVLEGIQLAIEKKVDVMVVDLDASTVLADGGFNFEDAIRAAWDAGIVPVVSAEHRTVRSNQFSDAPALVVGAVTREGAAAPQSDGVGAARWGISAPGGSGSGDQNDIFSTFFAHSKIGREYGRYAYEAGDAQAAAHVAAAAAILRGLGQTPQQTVERLLSSAKDAGATGRDRVFGVGLLHAGAAVRGLAAQGATSTGSGAPSPGGNTTGQGGGSTGSVTPPADGPTATAPPGRAGPDGAVSPPAGGSGTGTPAADTPSGEARSPGDMAVEGDDIVGGLADGRGPGDMPGRTPVLPLVAFLLLVGSVAIAWALRRRTLDPAPPINS